MTTVSCIAWIERYRRFLRRREAEAHADLAATRRLDDLLAILREDLRTLDLDIAAEDKGEISIFGYRPLFREDGRLSAITSIPAS